MRKRKAPPPRPAQGGPVPPKEDGEIGEAIQDVLARHPDLTSPPMQAYKRIEKLSEHATPGVEQVVGRCLSAALSPVEGAKVSPDTAMVGLVVAEQCLLKREYNWAVESYKREHRHWPSPIFRPGCTARTAT